MENAYLPIQANGKRPGLTLPALFKNRLLYHIAFWVIYYSCYAFFVLYNVYLVHDPTFYLQVSLFFPFDILLVYFNFYILIPRLLKSKKYLLYGLALLVSIFAAACIELAIKKMYVHFGYMLFATSVDFNLANVTGSMASRFYLLGLTTGIKLAKDWVENQQHQQEKENLYLETELNFLKTQINPHFFFNTLNNLYSLALKNSKQTPEVILKLSDLMSYMLYESNVAKVSLEKEVNYLQNYLDLEKLRFGERLTITFEIEGRMEEISIPPMVVIIFVENCFKHGLKDNIENVTVDIFLKVSGAFLYFTIKNPVSTHMSSSGISGIGLKNVKRRLDLLYQTNYSLDMLDDGKEYIVSLKMPV